MFLCICQLACLGALSFQIGQSDFDTAYLLSEARDLKIAEVIEGYRQKALRYKKLDAEESRLKKSGQALSDDARAEKDALLTEITEAGLEIEKRHLWIHGSTRPDLLTISGLVRSFGFSLDNPQIRETEIEALRDRGMYLADIEKLVSLITGDNSYEIVYRETHDRYDRVHLPKIIDRLKRAAGDRQKIELLRESRQAKKKMEHDAFWEWFEPVKAALSNRDQRILASYLTEELTQTMGTSETIDQEASIQQDLMMFKKLHAAGFDFKQDTEKRMHQ